MPQLDAFFKMMVEQGASDLHLISGQLPAMRINGELERVAGQTLLEQNHLQQLLYEIPPAAKKDQFESTGDVDFGYEVAGLARFRANLFRQKYGCAAVFRRIPTKVLTAEDLGLPPVLTKAAMLKK